MTIIVPLTELESILIETIQGADFEDLSKIAGELLGGECNYWGGKNEEFRFYPDENYNGTLDKFEKNEPETVATNIELHGYVTVDDYKNRNFTLIMDGLQDWTESVDEAKQWLNEYLIVKVYDGEDTELVLHPSLKSVEDII